MGCYFCLVMGKEENEEGEVMGWGGIEGGEVVGSIGPHIFC